MSVIESFVPGDDGQIRRVLSIFAMDTDTDPAERLASRTLSEYARRHNLVIVANSFRGSESRFQPKTGRRVLVECLVQAKATVDA